MVFCTCVLKISNYFIDFSPRNGDFGECKKKKPCLATKGRGDPCSKSIYGIFLGRSTKYYVKKNSKIVRVTARSIYAGIPHIQDLQQNGVKTNKLVFAINEGIGSMSFFGNRRDSIYCLI